MLRGHTDAVLCLQFDGHKVVSGSKDKTIKVISDLRKFCLLMCTCVTHVFQIWSLPDGVGKLTFYGHQAAVSCLHFDETRIISGALDRLIKMWNLMTGEVSALIIITCIKMRNFKLITARRSECACTLHVKIDRRNECTCSYSMYDVKFCFFVYN